MILRQTTDGIRVTIDGGIVSLGFEAMNRKALTPAEVALAADVVGLCDAAEVGRMIGLIRKHDTPRAVWAALGPKPDAAKRRSRRGEVRAVEYRPSLGMIVVERW